MAAHGPAQLVAHTDPRRRQPVEGCVVIAALIFAAVWTAIVVAVARTFIRASRNVEMARHIQQAVELTEPIGPEDRDDWGTR